MSFDRAELRAAKDRWHDRSERIDVNDWPEEWYRTQCGMCRYWIPLAGAIGLDWGVCANPASKWDGTSRFEHDGCDQFVTSDGWATPDTVKQ